MPELLIRIWIRINGFILAIVSVASRSFLLAALQLILPKIELGIRSMVNFYSIISHLKKEFHCCRVSKVKQDS